MLLQQNKLPKIETFILDVQVFGSGVVGMRVYGRTSREAKSQQTRAETTFYSIPV
jgi:hypothetical protein